MTIRGRLLQLLVPLLIGFITLISVFFYYNWNNEMMNSYVAYLKSVVTLTAQMVDAEEIARLADQNLENSERQSIYKHYQNIFENIQENLPSINIYVVQLEPVKKGELLLLDQPQSPINRRVEALEKTIFREKILLDFPQGKAGSVPESFYDLVDPEEHLAFKSKTSVVTPVHINPLNGERVMTAYAPILDKNHHVVALVAADANLNFIDRKLNQALALIVSGAAITTLLVITSVFLVANNLSKPVQKLKNAALAIAAGDYSESIQVQGPQEIVDLANTLNTMSECLDENLIRLKEASAARERMYGEYECSLLLQHQMLQKVVSDFKNPHLNLHHLKVSSSREIQGLMLNIDENPGKLSLTLVENSRKGFKNLYDLATAKYLSLDRLLQYVKIDFTDNYQDVCSSAQRMPIPFLWKIQEKNLYKISSQKMEYSYKDLIFIFNSALFECFENEVYLEKWLSKFLKHFSSESFPFFLTMLNNEINFLAKKKRLSQELHLICIQKEN